MSETKDAGAVRRLEDSITQLRGVRRTRIETSRGAIRSVRILVVPERTGADVAGRVAALLLRETGQVLSPEQIQVLRAGQSAPRPMQRRRLSSISTERTNSRFRARVVLELCGDTLAGESDAPNERTFELRSIARATLQGLSELLPERVELESVDVFGTGTHEVVIVAVDHVRGSLVGSALVRVDHHDAVARATLDAVNRLIAVPREVLDETTAS